MLRNLASGASIPVLAYGTGTAWYKRGGDDQVNQALVDSVKTALSLGYTHIDTAEGYGTEHEVGLAIAQSLVPRSSLFIATKVFSSIKDPVQALQASLSRMQLDYVDLYLIHSPFFSVESHGTTLEDAWRAMETLHRKGLARSIGVSNFREEDLERMLKIASVPPAVNQVELHAYLQNREMSEFCSKHSIQVEAYSPLAPLVHKMGGPVDEVVERIAKAHEKTAAQVLLRWSAHKGNVLVTTSSKEHRLKEFIGICDFELSEQEQIDIDEAGSQLKYRGFWTKQFEASKL